MCQNVNAVIKRNFCTSVLMLTENLDLFIIYF